MPETSSGWIISLSLVPASVWPQKGSSYEAAKELGKRNEECLCLDRDPCGSVQAQG